MMNKTTANGHRQFGETLRRAAALCLLALAALWCQATDARAQWTTTGTTTTTTNNVGIGTTTPSTAKLVIAGTAGETGLDLSSTDQYAELRVIRNSLNAGDKDLYLQWQAGAGSKLHFYSNNTETMTLNAGNVGIGTASPVGLLHVNGVDAQTYVSSAISSARITVQNTNTTNNNFGQLAFRTTDVNGTSFDAARIYSIYTSHAANAVSGDLALVTRNAGTSGEVARFTASGNVGIGTNTPGFLLDVAGSASTPLRVRDSSGREYISTGIRTGPVATWTTPILSLSGGRLIVDSTSADGGNDTIVRHVVNSLIFNPSDHPTLPGAFMVRQVGGNAALFIDQNANGNVGIGTTAPASKLHVAGNITVDGNINAKYQDVAEWVPTTEKLSAGTVVVLDVERDNHVAASTTSYDTRVAGVVSAQPGISLGEAGEGKALVATTGRVKVKVDATQGPIKVGDLLVTGNRPGYAMKSEPIQIGGRQIHAPGTIIGKALSSLDKGTGEILVLLSLQ